FDARAHDVAWLGRLGGGLDLRRRRGLRRIELGAQLLATLGGPVLLGERGDGADRDIEPRGDIPLREPDALRLAVLIGHHLALDQQALDLVGVRELRAFALRGTANLRGLVLRHVPSEADGELDRGRGGEQRLQALHRARPLPLEALVETLAGHVVVGLETLDVRAQKFSAQHRRLDYVEPARGEALLDRALNEQREVVQLLVRARATGSEGVRVEVFQLLDVDARVA